MSTPYLTAGYALPIPILSVRFRALAASDTTDVIDAIVDTGADMTVAPIQLFIDLDAQDVQESYLISQWGDRHPVTLFIVDLDIAGHVLPGVLVAGDESANEVILGRNVLNLLPVFLDGPSQHCLIPNENDVKRLRVA
jgi:predicted aspartyl protease